MEGGWLEEKQETEYEELEMTINFAGYMLHVCMAQNNVWELYSFW